MPPPGRDLEPLASDDPETPLYATGRNAGPPRPPGTRPGIDAPAEAGPRGVIVPSGGYAYHTGGVNGRDHASMGIAEG